jgi:hypothetical protein
MRWKLICLLPGLLALAPAAALAECPCIPGYDQAQISTANSTVTMLSLPSYTNGVLRGLKCVFPTGGSVRVEFTTNGVNHFSLVVDSSFFERESSGAGQELSGWIPMFVFWNSAILVQLNNTGLGTNTITCWDSWTTTEIE